MGKIYAAKTNHITNPIGFYMEHTVFSWKVQGCEGKKQKYARIQVGGDEDFAELLLDTGETDLDSLATKVKLDLQPRTRYYWKVTVTTDAGEVITSNVQFFETGKQKEAWHGKWISCDSTDPRHPLFIKKVHPKKEVKKARLYICGLGLYEAYFSSDLGDKAIKIGSEYLTPYCNNYDQWIQYQTFDVTEHIGGEVSLSVLLGNGWYKGRFGINQAEDKACFSDSWKLIAELHLEYVDGAREIIGTDDSWQVGRSNITFSNIYDGEKRDDTLPEVKPVQAMLAGAPKGRLTARLSLPVKVHEIFMPKEIIRTPAGETVIDLGQEITGIFRLIVHEPAGTQIKLQTGEILQKENFYNENLRTAKSEYIYVSDGNEHIIEPKFTFYGYRYVKVHGISELKPEHFTGIALYSDFEMVGNITTGHDLVNRLISNIIWGMKDNFLDVPTDCPQRDERMGWTGDAQIFSPTACFLADTYAFYRKFLYDVYQEQLMREGMVPVVVPSIGTPLCSSFWGDAACIIPWNIYEFSGDKTIIEEQYASMKAWVDFVSRLDGDNHGWGHSFHFGDWLALDKAGAGADNVYGATDEEYIANICFMASADIVAKAAELLGDAKDAAHYAALAGRQRKYIKAEYFTTLGRCAVKTQTGLLLALKYHLSSDENKIRNMLKTLLRDSGNKLNTGFVGTPLLCNILTDNGMSDIAYILLMNEDYPGWLREVKLGATTVWERWNSLDDEGNISSTSMNSLNHYSYGSVLEWMFRYVGGINLIGIAPGAREVSISPIVNWNLKQAKATYDSASGLYECSWEIVDKKNIRLAITIPFGGRAKVKLPLAPADVYENKSNPLFKDVVNGQCVVVAGNYQLEYEATEPLKPVYNTNSKMADLLDNPRIKAFFKTLLGVDMIPGADYELTFRQMAEKYIQGNLEEKFAQIDTVLSAY